MWLGAPEDHSNIFSPVLRVWSSIYPLDFLSKDHTKHMTTVCPKWEMDDMMCASSSSAAAAAGSQRII
jgi:hypothetical protein